MQNSTDIGLAPLRASRIDEASPLRGWRFQLRWCHGGVVLRKVLVEHHVSSECTNSRGVYFDLVPPGLAECKVVVLARSEEALARVTTHERLGALGRWAPATQQLAALWVVMVMSVPGYMVANAPPSSSLFLNTCVGDVAASLISMLLPGETTFYPLAGDGGW